MEKLARSMCEGRKEDGESKLGEAGIKNWALPQMYCLKEIEEESLGWGGRERIGSTG